MIGAKGIERDQEDVRTGLHTIAELCDVREEKHSADERYGEQTCRQGQAFCDGMPGFGRG
ncbi:MAG: hypothetical protein BroJett003_16770 [Planctomycetota bacterium]|nr:MAG: hypothetical protein BroJett003_16770 [Planctomycetota bacterium]